MTQVHHGGCTNQLGDFGIAAAPRKQRGVERLQQVHVLLATATNRPHGIAVVRVEHRGKSSEHFHVFLEHDVGLVETPLRPRLWMVVNLHHESRASDRGVHRKARQRSEDRRNGGGRRSGLRRGCRSNGFLCRALVGRATGAAGTGCDNQEGGETANLQNATRGTEHGVLLRLDLAQERYALGEWGVGIEEFMEKPQPTRVIHPRQRLLNPHMGRGH